MLLGSGKSQILLILTMCELILSGMIRNKSIRNYSHQRKQRSKSNNHVPYELLLSDNMTDDSSKIDINSDNYKSPNNNVVNDHNRPKIKNTKMTDGSSMDEQEGNSQADIDYFSILPEQHMSHQLTNRTLSTKMSIPGLIRVQNSCEDSYIINKSARLGSILYGVGHIYDGSSGYVQANYLESSDLSKESKPDKYLWRINRVDDYNHFTIQLYNDASLCLTAPLYDLPHIPTHLELRNCFRGPHDPEEKKGGIEVEETSAEKERITNGETGRDSLLHSTMTTQMKSQTFELISPFGICMTHDKYPRCLSLNCKNNYVYLEEQRVDLPNGLLSASTFYQIDFLEDFANFVDEINNLPLTFEMDHIEKDENFEIQLRSKQTTLNKLNKDKDKEVEIVEMNQLLKKTQQVDLVSSSSSLKLPLIIIVLPKLSKILLF